MGNQDFKHMDSRKGFQNSPAKNSLTRAPSGSSEAKGELYLLIDAKTKTFGFNTVAVVVPVTVQVKAFAKVQAGGEISYNWSTNQADGGVKLDVTVGLNAFTGVGVGIVAGAGVYGQADEDAILDDAPALCAAADGTVWLAYARSTADPQEDLLTYAENQSIVVGRIDPETLEFTESTTYPGQSYAHLQQLTAVNGQPVLVWADSEVPDADSVLFSPRSRICTAEWYTYNNTALLSVVRMTEPTTIRSAQISGGQVIVQFASTENASCTACCALYDAYGKLLKLTEASISPGEQEIRFDTAGTFDTAKIFLLDAAFTPLCEALTLKAT